ncbi:transcriptional regulator [Acinetobacter bereziniae]|uniref:transcriptional regulator n=1 Tax=Acinetobacter bereziniae TaxID=106648 RepID=UPI0018DEA01B|nr:transcriptional regulator [Acinetobacter bereziniae]MBI0395451.1 transcriptional regulator [Acinetobacter bereziniae]
MLELRYRVNDLVNYPECQAKDYIYLDGHHRRLSHKSATKGSLNVAETTFWKMIHHGDFLEPPYLTASISTRAESQIYGCC